MRRTQWLDFLRSAVLLVAAVAVVRGSASALGTEQTVYSFTGGTDGGGPHTGLVFDSLGNAYGTTVTGGISGCGTVFKLTPSTGQEQVLWNFGCFADGKNPYGGVAFDGAGHLFGTTVAGGTGGVCVGDGCGEVYELTTAGITVLYSFKGGNDGFGPGSALVFDKAGHLFGMTPDGGQFSSGTVFELSKASGHWVHTVIHNFTGGADGATGSLGPLLVAHDGTLYGVAETGGGSAGAGAVFKMSPARGGGWNFVTLHQFKGMPDGYGPYGGLVADAKGNLFGTTYFGGSSGNGTIFEMIPMRGGKWSELVLRSFQGGSDGSWPTGTLILSSDGKTLYGTTTAGGTTSCDCGTIFRYSRGDGIEQVMHRFGAGNDGQAPYYALAADPSGNLFSTAVAGGQHGQGTVFNFVP